MRLAPAIPADAEPLAQILADWVDETAWMPNNHTPHEDIRFLAREGFDEVELTDGAGNDEQVPDVRLIWTNEDRT